MHYWFMYILSQVDLIFKLFSLVNFLSHFFLHKNKEKKSTDIFSHANIFYSIVIEIPVDYFPVCEYIHHQICTHENSFPKKSQS